MDVRLTQTPIRAPQEDGGYLLKWPQRSDAENLRQALDQRFPFAAAQRQQSLQQAIQWTSQYIPAASKVDEDAEHGSLIMSGHQPELFHAGVWFKNFVLAGVANRSQQTAINLIIDNDQQKSNWLSFPAIEGGRTVTRRANFAYGGLGQPYEERTVEDEALFASLPERVRQRAANFAKCELLSEFWEYAREMPFQNVGYRFAAARHMMEWERGINNLELPLSYLCDSSGFFHFVFEILQSPTQFFEIHNQVLRQYRMVNGLSNEDRPVANLEMIDGWLELPFWLWSDRWPYRQKLFAKDQAEGCEICSQSFLENSGNGFHKIVNDAADLQDLGAWKLRTRALTTTMYCRTVLCDSFLHGIGGAIYDQLTDEITRQFFEVQLPHFLTATATCRLPGPSSDVAAEDLEHAKLRLRELQWKPERFVDADGPLGSFVATKERLLKSVPTRAAKRSWQSQIEEVNETLRQSLADKIETQQELIQSTQRQLTDQKIENSREWSFLLFDRSLPSQLQALAERALHESV